jgi:hypothetical protein
MDNKKVLIEKASNGYILRVRSDEARFDYGLPTVLLQDENELMEYLAGFFCDEEHDHDD